MKVLRSTSTLRCSLIRTLGFFGLLAVGALAAAAPAAGQISLEDAIADFEFREIGPALMGGRIADLAVVEAKPQVFYIGTASGGLWKTENHGTSWTPLFDDQPTSSIGDVEIHQENPNLVWVGTGEPQNRQSSPWGNGVYKSTDGGITWEHMGLDNTKHIGRVLINPRNPDIVWVAAVGNLWGPNEERGVFRTQDGGETWEKVLYITSTSTPARSTWRWIRPTPTRSSPRCISGSARGGASTAADPGAGSTAPWTVARPGPS